MQLGSISLVKLPMEKNKWQSFAWKEKWSPTYQGKKIWDYTFLKKFGYLGNLKGLRTLEVG
jgi:hypothetical protein